MFKPGPSLTSDPSDFAILEATMSDSWGDGVGARTGWPAVSIL